MFARRLISTFAFSLLLGAEAIAQAPSYARVSPLDPIELGLKELPAYVYDLRLPSHLYHWNNLDSLRYMAEIHRASGGGVPLKPLGDSRIGGILNYWKIQPSKPVLFASEDPVGGLGRDGATYARPEQAGTDSKSWSSPRPSLGRDANPQEPKQSLWRRLLSSPRSASNQPKLDDAPEAVRARAALREKNFEKGARSAYLLTMQPRKDAKIGLAVTVYNQAMDLTPFLAKLPKNIITDPNRLDEADLVYHVSYDNIAHPELAFQEWVIRNPVAIEAMSARPEAAAKQIQASLAELDASPTRKLAPRKMIFPGVPLPKNFRDLLEDYLQLGGRDLPPEFDRPLVPGSCERLFSGVGR